MPTINIRTTLNTGHCKPPKFIRTYITRGATAKFTVDLTEYLENKNYTIADINQITFWFKQYKNTIWNFSKIFNSNEEEVEEEVEEGYEIIIDGNIVTLTLSSDITTQFEPTGFDFNDEYDLVSYEIAIELKPINNQTSGDTDIIKYPSIGVKDSIYAQYEEEEPEEEDGE